MQIEIPRCWRTRRSLFRQKFLGASWLGEICFLRAGWLGPPPGYRSQRRRQTTAGSIGVPPGLCADIPDGQRWRQGTSTAAASAGPDGSRAEPRRAPIYLDTSAPTAPKAGDGGREGRMTIGWTVTAPAETGPAAADLCLQTHHQAGAVRICTVMGGGRGLWYCSARMVYRCVSQCIDQFSSGQLHSWLDDHIERQPGTQLQPFSEGCIRVAFAFSW